MSLLILGANGQLGFELCRQARKKNIPAACCDLPTFDITSRKDINEQIINSSCRLVINASAYTAVDKAEQDAETAFAVNAQGPRKLATACAQHHIPLIHVSTDYVFDGSQKSPYQPADPVCPIGIYGKSKAAGEAAIIETLDNHIIIRTAWLYGEHGNNFVKTMLRLGAERDSIGVVMDQFGNPTCAADLADALLHITQRILDGENSHWGIYHYTGNGTVSWHAFAQAIFDEAKKYTSLKIDTIAPITTEQYPTPAARPKNSVLDCSLTEKHFDLRTRPWRESLNTTIGNLFHP